ncbi:bifunctional 4-hydroxy-2-oxoglutarate aldolase/2-dehydro-3-deoxy-phosphogluconate aldolase [Mollicutes bacterium LVI A0078]|nr:bifunctional 4-hydroxy-2-oxoglutarate aldolase/2-dehydro-3-deoxy-phosphogluconate aldolase [Mollicutes bacterium LVI A0075]WOO90395.1 bifunctional 4-hydroxy-2-oxoglutarate aldolase/2-dehydro-3-deoxy-phosphogluconate aldolase [Mollicutes bacterium LVI A0078]
MLDKLKQEKVVAVLRASSVDEGMEYVEAIYAGGMKALELTYSIPNVCELIRQVLSKYPDALVGIGSVLTVDQTKDALAAGATYIVSPGYVESVQDYCNEVGAIYMPGAMTVSEIIRSMEKGNAIAKVFPGDVLGTSFIKGVKAPIPNAQLMVTGGVDIDNVKDWFAAGVTMVGIGSSLTAPGKSGDFEAITALAKRFKEETK